MLVIHKYEMRQVSDVLTIDIPQGAKFLHFAAQHDRPCLWCLVDTDSPKMPHRFRFAGTGQDLSPYTADELQYIGTAQFNGGSLVFHLFYVKP